MQRCLERTLPFVAGVMLTAWAVTNPAVQPMLGFAPADAPRSPMRGDAHRGRKLGEKVRGVLFTKSRVGGGLGEAMEDVEDASGIAAEGAGAEGAQAAGGDSTQPKKPFNYWEPIKDDDPDFPLLPRNPKKQKIRIITPDELANGEYHMNGLEEELKKQETHFTADGQAIRPDNTGKATAAQQKAAQQVLAVTGGARKESGGGSTGKAEGNGATATVTQEQTKRDEVQKRQMRQQQSVLQQADRQEHTSDLRAQFEEALRKHWFSGDLSRMAGITQRIASDTSADDDLRYEAHIYTGVALCTGCEPGALDGPEVPLSWVNMYWSGAQGYLCRCHDELYSKEHCEDQQRRAEEHARSAIELKPNDSAGYYLLAKVSGGPMNWPSYNFEVSLDAYNKAAERGNGLKLRPDLNTFAGAARSSVAQLLGAAAWGMDDHIHNMTYLRAAMKAWRHDYTYMDTLRENEDNGIPHVIEDGHPAHNKFRVVKEIIPRDLAIAGYHYFMGLWEDNMVRYDEYDSLVYDKTAFMFYSNPFSESLAEYVRPKVEEWCGKKLVHAYSAGRVYLKGTDLKLHSDRPAAQYSVTVTLGYPDDDPGWPLFIDSHDGGKTVTMANLEPGDGLAYQGVNCEHWRGMLRSKNHVQVFLHFVDAEGPFQTSFFEGLHVGSYMVNVFGQRWAHDGKYSDPHAWRTARERWCRGDKVGSVEDFARIGVSRGEGALMNLLRVDRSPEAQKSYSLIMDLANGRRYAMDTVYKKIVDSHTATWVEKGDQMLEWLSREFHDLGVKHHNASLLDAATTIIERREIWNRCNGQPSAFKEECCWH